MNFFKGLKRFPFLSVMIAAALIAAVVIVLERMPGHVDRPAVPDIRQRESRDRVSEPKTPEQMQPEPEGRGQRIVIIIDDIGTNPRLVEELARIRAPIAFAILPHTPYAVEAARRLHAAGKEILLHLPMEPRSYPTDNPGAGALFVKMDEDEIVRQLESDLAAVPYVSGVNNHMGSRFMEDESRLFIVMRELSKRGLFFVDSLTTSHSRGREAAARAGVRFAVRSVFIDHTPGYATALSNLTRPTGQDRGKGKLMMMIGHPHPETVRAITEAQAFWQAEGTQMIPLSAYLNMPGGKEKQDAFARKR